MPVEQTFPHVLFHIGAMPIRDSVVVTWGIVLVLGLVSFVATRRLHDRPGPLQNVLESMVEIVEAQIAEVTRFDPKHFVPFIGTLGLFLVVADTVPLFPGVGSPTRDISTTVALAVIVFVSVHVYGVWLVGPARYLRTYVDPHWLLLPFNIIGEITRTIALALRLFGNMLSGELVVAILLMLAGFLIPVPLQLLGLLIGVIQAYVFTLLAMVYIAAGLRHGERDEGDGSELAGEAKTPDVGRAEKGTT